MEISEVSAIVAGGASGLGEGAVRRLAGAGVECLIADLDVDRGAALAEELGPHVRFVRADITDESSMQALISIERRQPLRIMLTTAFTGAGGAILGNDGKPYSLEAFRRQIDINLVGTFNCMRMGAAAIAQSPPDATGERGVIINTASIAAFDGQEHQVAYAAAKAAIVGMTLPAARDLGHYGIRVMTIAPGTFATPPLMSGSFKDYRSRFEEAAVWPRRLGQADEFGLLVEHICHNSYLNAETIRLDGGARLPRTII